MTQIAGPTYTGQLACDLTDVKDVLVDLAPGALRGARYAQDGIAEVLGELARVMPEHAEDAEIRGTVYDRVTESTAYLAKLTEHEIVLSKLLEVVRETKGMLENNREHALNTIAARAADTAKRNKKPELLAQFEKTIAYRAQPGRKAYATRKKNKALQSAEEPNG